MVRGLLSTITANSSFLPLSPNSCFFWASGGFPSSSGGAAVFFRRASLCIRVQELVRDGLRPHSFGRILLRVRGTSSSSRGGLDALGVGISKMKKGSVECSGSSSAAETSSSENVQAVPKVRLSIAMCF